LEPRPASPTDRAKSAHIGRAARPDSARRRDNLIGATPAGAQRPVHVVRSHVEASTARAAARRHGFAPGPAPVLPRSCPGPARSCPGPARPAARRRPTPASTGSRAHWHRCGPGSSKPTWRAPSGGHDGAHPNRQRPSHGRPFTGSRAHATCGQTCGRLPAAWSPGQKVRTTPGNAFTSTTSPARWDEPPHGCSLHLGQMDRFAPALETARGGRRRSPDCGGTGDGRTAHQALSRPYERSTTAARPAARSSLGLLSAAVVSYLHDFIRTI
jgi:hypothetical protein